jgi:hypothetical protein
MRTLPCGETMKSIVIGMLALAGLLYVGCSKLDSNTGVLFLNKCLVCHDVPPNDTLHKVHAVLHQYDCDVCHKGNSVLHGSFAAAPTHDNGVINVNFSSFFGLDEKGANYSTSTKTCQQVYCHGNFLDGKGGTVTVSDTIRSNCSACHDTLGMRTLGHPRTDTLTWHRHRFWVIVKDCNNCHPGYSVTDRTVDTLTHVNGVFDVQPKSSCYAKCHPELVGK